MAKQANQRRASIEINYAACTGCRLCETACSLFHENAVWLDASRIRVEQYYPGPLDIPVICHRCFERYCVEACPTPALSYDATAEVVRVSNDDCIQCQACYTACPHTGAIAPHPQTNLPILCDLCDGNPRCVAACPAGCLQWVQGSTFSPAHYVITPPEEIARSLSSIYYPAKECL
ncbi:anaerobic carbon-monoxide dehydrogenase iron sulfur subunit [Anaerolineae bacterium]|nr:anaerobic carbon-monoxide dehydrogenase iron sulfur subunit [Anaerolineae bacterium]